MRFILLTAGLLLPCSAFAGLLLNAPLNGAVDFADGQTPTCSTGPATAIDAGFAISSDGPACFSWTRGWDFADNGAWFSPFGEIGDNSTTTTLTINLGGLYSSVTGFLDYGLGCPPDFSGPCETQGNAPRITALDVNRNIIESFDLTGYILGSNREFNFEAGEAIGIVEDQPVIAYLQIGGDGIALADLAVAGGVPEPSTWVLVAGGLALILLPRRFRQWSAFCLLAGVFIPGTSQAASIGYAYGSVFGAPYNRNPGQLASCSFDLARTAVSGNCGYMSVGSIDKNSNDGLQWAGSGDLFNAFISSSVDPTGGLHATLDVSFTNEPVDTGNCTRLQCSSTAFADVYAFSSDGLTFTSGGSQVPFQVVANFTIDGTQGSSLEQESIGMAITSGGTFTTSGSSTFQQSSGPLNPGQIFYYSLFVHLSAELVCNSTVRDGGAHLCSTNEFLDYSNTEKISSLVIEDLSGNVLSGYSVTSQSGADYNSLVSGGANSAPEPSTLVMSALAGGLCLAVSASLRRRRS